MKDKKLVSSHIFIFPFKWDYIEKECALNSTIDKRINMEKFKKYLVKTGHWEEENFGVNSEKQYNSYAYFYENVLSAIYHKRDEYEKKEKSLDLSKVKYGAYKIIKNNCSKEIVKCFNCKGINEESKYIINIKGQRDPYELQIKQIKLKIYSTGVGCLTYFLDNFNEKTTPQDILKINDYGRRIYPQFLPLDDIKCKILPNKMSANINFNLRIQESFNDNSDRISNLIMDLLGSDFYCNKNKFQPNKILIRPVIDDRMFTLSIYGNDDISRCLSNSKKQKYLKNDFWYQYTFVDHDGPTCQDKYMLEELVKRATYTRWTEYGTLYGITRYSFVIIRDESDNAQFLIDHFYGMYYEMVLLALSQRASCLRFLEECSKIAALSEKEALIRVKKIQKDYIKFSNDIYFEEVTPQEQGIELYSMLQDKMEIKRDVKRLKDEINSIQSYTSTIENEKTSKLLEIIAYVGVALPVCELARDVFGQQNLNFKNAGQAISEAWNNEYIWWLLQRTIWPLGILIIFFTLINKISNEKKNMLAKITLLILWVLSVVLFLGR